MGIWQGTNRLLYRAWRSFRSEGRIPAPAPALCTVPDTPRGGVLVLAWGRIGDLILATGFLSRLRSLVPDEPLHLIGRAEVGPVVAGLVDRFLPWDGGAPEAVAAVLGRRYRIALGDLHLFYGGTRAVAEWFDRVAAERRLLYQGYHLGVGLEPSPWFPSGWDLVPGLAKPTGAEQLALRHVTRDQDHYLGQIAEALERDLPSPATPSLAHLSLDRELPARSGFAPGSYLTMQPVSNNPKKDWLLERFAELLAAFPEQRFVALGSPREAERIAGLRASNLHTEAIGNTGLVDSFAWIAGARAHLGLDSGLSHAAAALGVPTLCVAQSSNLGYFFPYPPELGAGPVTVAHETYRSCSGCFMTCTHEPIWRTRLQGALCLRSLPVAPVRDALTELLAQGAARPGGRATASGQLGPAR